MKASTPRIVLVEDDPHGHRLMYVATFVYGAQHEGQQIIFLTTSAVERTEEFREHLHTLAVDGRVRVVVTPGRGTGLTIRDLLRHTRPQDCIVVLDGDRRLIRLLPIFLRRRGIALLMRTEGSSLRSRVAQWQKALICWLGIASGRWSFRRLVGARTNEAPAACRALHWLPGVEDPGPVALVVPDEELITPASYVLLCGVIDTRKSLAQLLDWAAHTMLPDPPTLVVAGRLTDAAAEILSGPASRELVDQQRLYVIPRFLTNSELAALYVRADGVFALHENPGPSGAVAHAIRYGRPVITWGSEAVRRSAAAAGLGIDIPDRGVAAIDAAVTRLRLQQPTGRLTGNAELAYCGRRFASQILAGRN